MARVGHAGLRALLFGALATSTALVVPTIATAQDVDDPGERGATLLQRLVLGFGSEKVAVDAPTAVTVVDQDQIDEEIAETVSDVLVKIPGVNATGNPDNILGQNFNIRGFGPQPVGSNQEGRVQVNVDGATKYYESYRMGGFFGDSELYKAVEVLRGPASGTLYGTAVLGGVINFTTKDASDFLDEGDNGALKVKGTYDSNQEGYRASAILALRMGDNAEFLGSFNYTDFKDIVDGNGDALDGTAQAFPSGLAKGTFYLDDAKESIFRVKYEQTQVDGVMTTTPGGPGVSRPLSERTASDTSVVLSYENEASDNPWLDLNVNLTYSNLSNRQSAAPLSGNFIEADFDYTYYELKADNTFEWLGDDYENYLTVGMAAKYHERRRFDLDGTPAGSHPEGNERYVGVFAQNEFIYDDRLTLIGGLRVDWRELQPTGTTFTYNAAGRFDPPNVIDRPVLPTSVSDIAFAPKVAALYEVTDWVNVFGSYSYTERMPGIDEEFSFAGDGAAFPQTNIGKEKAHTVEAGISGSVDDVFLADDNLSYKLTGFYTHINDLVVRDSDAQGAGPFPEYVNQGTAEIYGAELELAYDSTYFFASAYASLLRGNNTFLNEPFPSIAPDELGFTIGGKIPDYDIRFGWDARFVAAQNRTAVIVASQDPSDAFSTHDIWASWKPEDGMFEGFEATARFDNITDEFYQEYLSTAGPAKGRTFKASLGYTLKF
ncbi:MAG: TonB-dependent receptor [Pseudomonadota bacterium]